jgi:hypothetical protein
MITSYADIVTENRDTSAMIYRDLLTPFTTYKDHKIKTPYYNSIAVSIFIKKNTAAPVTAYN